MRNQFFEPGTRAGIVIFSGLILTVGAVEGRASTFTLQDTGQFATRADMFNGASPQIDFKIRALDVRSPRREVFSTIKDYETAASIARRTSWDVANAAYQLCRNTFNFGCSHPGSKPSRRFDRVGDRVTLGSVRATYDIGVDVAVGVGSVDVSQDFAVNMRIDNSAAQAGEVVTLQTSLDFGETSLSSELDSFVLDTTGEANVSWQGLDYENWFVGRGKNEGTLGDYSSGKVKGPGLGVEVGGGVIDLRRNGKTVGVNLSDGASFEIGPSVLPLVTTPFADVTGYTPNLDIDDARSNDGSGRIAVGNDLSQEFTGSASLFTGSNPVETGRLKRLDIDVDGLTRFLGAPPLGAVAGVPIVGNFQANILDADVGVITSIQQQQVFEAKNVSVRFDFSAPIEIEVAPGQFELTTSFELQAGEDLSYRQPSEPVTVTTEYVLTDNTYQNDVDVFRAILTETKILDFKLTLLTEVLEEGTVVNLTGQSPFINPLSLFDESVTLGGFNSVSGSRFAVGAGSVPDLTPVPLPAPVLLLLVALTPFAMFRKSKKRF